MVAGLTQVDMDLASQSVASKFMACKGQIHYEDAVSETASRYHTEVTRMLYAYAALENTVRCIDPTVGESSVPKAARRLINAGGPSVPLHYDCVLKHLQWHVSNNPALKQNEKLRKKFEVPTNYHPSVVSAEVGIQFRHLAAHGMLPEAVPFPIRSNEGWEKGGHSETCTAREATTCLLFAVQMLFRTALHTGELPRDRVFDIDEGLWLQGPKGGAWVYEMTAEERLMTVHLRTDEGPSD